MLGKVGDIASGFKDVACSKKIVVRCFVACRVRRVDDWIIALMNGLEITSVSFGCTVWIRVDVAFRAKVL